MDRSGSRMWRIYVEKSPESLVSQPVPLEPGGESRMHTTGTRLGHDSYSMFLSMSGRELRQSAHFPAYRTFSCSAARTHTLNLWGRCWQNRLDTGTTMSAIAFRSRLTDRQRIPL